MSAGLKPERFMDRRAACLETYGRWFVAINEGGDYLHSDGAVRFGTQADGGKWSGFFETEAEALAAIEAYQAKSEVKP